MFKRWWIYQQERFPLISNGILIVVFSSAAVGYSALLRNQKPTSWEICAACISIFLFFLQLRIADEFKDFDDDRRYRPYRPVPRGLISLRELGFLGIFTLVIQLGIALSLSKNLAFLLALVWLYLALMSQEFFISSWLKAHPIIYLLSHNLILPLICLYGSAWDWLLDRAPFPTDILWFLLLSSANGLVFEIGRKIRAPQDEEIGVETYTHLWGKENAILAWVYAVCLSAVAAFFAARSIHFHKNIGPLLFLLGMAASSVAYAFFNHPTRQRAKLIYIASALWTLGLYLGLGIIPFFLNHKP